MTRVFGVHTIEFRPGIREEDFEKFVIEEYLPALPLSETPGMEIHLLKGERGEHVGQYLFLFEFDSVETRNRYFPRFNQPSDEILRLIAPLRPLAERCDAMSERSKTDYVVLDE